VAAPHVRAGSGVLGQARHLVVRLLPDLLGQAEFFWNGPRAGVAWSAAVFALYGPILLYGLAVVCRPGRPTAEGGLDPRRGGARMVGLALLLAGAQLVFTRYDLSRYLMPIYSAVPVLFVGVAALLWRHARWLAPVFAAGVLGLHLADDVRLFQGHSRPVTGRPVGELVEWLERAGTRHLYAHFRVAWPIAFESRERVLAADFHDAGGFLAGKTRRGARSGVYMRPYYAMADAVDAAPRVALVTHEYFRLPAAEQLRQALTLLHAGYQEHRIGDYTVFYDFRRPVGPLREIPARAIRLRASHEAARARLALDRNISTAWSTDGPARPGHTVELELDRPRPVARIVLDPGTRVKGFPRGLRVEVSDEGRHWRVVVDVPAHTGGIDWLAGHPKLNVQGKVAVWLPPVRTRFIRLTQTADPRDRQSWVIAELFLYEEAEPGAPARPAPGVAEEDRGPLLATLARDGIRTVYGFDEANVFFTQHRSARLTTVTGHDTRPVEQRERVVRFDKPRAFFLPGPSPALEAQLGRLGVPFEVRRFRSGVLYVTSARAGVPSRYWDYEQLLALGVDAPPGESGPDGEPDTVVGPPGVSPGLGEPVPSLF
jgi:hypothetical protein